MRYREGYCIFESGKSMTIEKRKITGETYSVEYLEDEHRIIFSGFFRLQSIESYEEIIDFVMHYAINYNKTLSLDVSKLEVINSSGIASLGLFFVKLRDHDNEKKIKMLASKYIYWQANSLKDLTELNENLEIEYIVHH